jgi:transcriptional regulator with XRE-family HTH domain
MQDGALGRGDAAAPVASSNDDGDARDEAYGRRVGERLRAIRRQKGLSLQEVEASSRQEFKASVVGAYERGERAISVPRLQRLAIFYNVPVDQLLPREGADSRIVDLTERATSAPRSVTIDLARLRELQIPGGDLLIRYLEMIQVQRQDFNGRILTIRQDDLRAIACILGVGIEDAASQLELLGLSLVG